MKTNEIFRTSDYGLAGYLCAMGMTLLGSIPTEDPKRYDFCFIADKDQQRFLDDYLSGKGVVIARHYYSKLRMVTRSLKDPVKIEDFQK